MKSDSPYCGSLTREQFLLPEMRVVANLMQSEYSDNEIVKEVFDKNLFQYPTEKMISRMAKTCLCRLHGLSDSRLITLIATGGSGIAAQICLYALMRQNRLVWDFMITVIGEKFRTLDLSFNRAVVTSFFHRLQEQDDGVRQWSDSTIQRIKQILIRILIDAGYLDSGSASKLNPIWIDRTLEEVIRLNHDELALPAFNCLI